MHRERAAAAALFALLALALFAPALAGGRLFFPVHSERLLPWRSNVPAERLAADRASENTALTDKLWLFDPDTSVAVAELERGRLPTWNPSIAGGAPFLGQALYGALYPPNLLLWRLMPLTASYAWGAALHVFIAAFGLCLFARALGASRTAALFAGLLFAAGGPLVVRYHYYMTFYPVAWIPWLLLAVRSFALRPTLLRFVLIPPPIALAILTGFPQTALYGIAGAGIFGAWQLVVNGPRPAREAQDDRARERAGSWRPLLALGGAFALGFALAAAQILPFDEAARRSLPRVHDAAKQIEESGSPWMLAGYVVPDAFEDPHEPWSSSPLTNPLWNALYCGTTPKVNGEAQPAGLAAQPNPTETSCWVGALGLLLALAGLAGGPVRLRIGLVVALAACWGYALGWPPLVRLVALLPRMDVGEVRRIVPTGGLLVALLAALGAEHLLEKRAARTRRVVLAVALALAAGLGAFALLVHQAGPDGVAAFLRRCQIERYGARLVAAYEKQVELSADLRASVAAFVTRRLSFAALSFAGAALALLVADRLVARGRTALAAGLLLLGCAVELATYHFRTNPFVASDGFLAHDTLLEPLAASVSGGRVDRYAPGYRLGGDTIEQLVLPPNVGARFGIEDLEAYIVMVPTRMARFRRALEPEVAPDSSVATVAILPLRTTAALASALLDLASVRYVLTTRDLLADLAGDGYGDAGFRLAAQRGETRIYENREALPFATVLPEALFLAAAPPDDAIATPADASPTIASAPTDERARLQATLLHDASRIKGLIERRVVLEAAPPAAAADSPFDGDTEEVALGGERRELPRRRVRGTPARVESIERRATHVVVRLAAGDGGFLRLAEGFDPGWSATCDGAPLPVVPADVAFRGVVLPKGAKEVVFDYRPVAVVWGKLVSLLALMLLLALSAIGGARRPRPADRAAAAARAG
jgi:hypothetical protein